MTVVVELLIMSITWTSGCLLCWFSSGVLGVLSDSMVWFWLKVEVVRPWAWLWLFPFHRRWSEQVFTVWSSDEHLR